MRSSPPADIAIECNGLSRSFGSHVAVKDVTFSIEPGSVLALLGHNGAGKTTTIRLLNGVLAPDSGTMSVLGLDPVTQGHELRARTGVLTEIAGLDDRLTARENLSTSAALRGLRGPEVDRRIDGLLSQFEMGRHAHSRCQGFSTGQRRRVAIARSLIHNPEVLFLDEPTSGLDPAGSQAVLKLISSFATEHRRTVVLCTHFLAEAGALADYMCLMNQGGVEVFGKPAELAATMWPYLEVEFDMGAPIDRTDLEALRQSSTVIDATPAQHGVRVNVADRTDIPAANAWFVSNDLPIFGVHPKPKGLEDVYFAYQGTDAGHSDIGPARREAATQGESGSSETHP